MCEEFPTPFKQKFHTKKVSFSAKIHHHHYQHYCDAIQEWIFIFSLTHFIRNKNESFLFFFCFNFIQIVIVVLCLLDSFGY